MNELQILKAENFGNVKCDFWQTEDGDVLITREQIGKALEYKHPQKAIGNLHSRNYSRLRDHVVDLKLRGTDGKMYSTALYTAKGVYEICRASGQPKADEFMDWVWEVLESIRKHGGYIKNQENISSEEILANAVLVAQNVIKEKDKLLEEQRPKVLFAEAVENSDDVILVKEMANIISQRGFTIGQNQLFQYLRNKKFLCSKKGDMYHLPTKRYQHLFKVTKNIVQNSKGSKVSNTPKITGKGQMYFIKKFDEFLEQGLTVKDLLKKY